jgi:hypothetical protein
MCPEMSFCRQGECVGSCALISCSLNEICIDGQCLDVLCGGAVCLEGETCNDDNTCLTDPCLSLSCEQGQACVEGECQADPCLGITCPPGGRCEVIQDSAQCTGDESALEPPPEEYQDPISPTEGGLMMMGGMQMPEGGIMEPMNGGELMGGEPMTTLIPVDLGMLDPPSPSPIGESSEMDSATLAANEGCAQKNSSTPLTPESFLLFLLLIGYQGYKKGRVFRKYPV